MLAVEASSRVPALHRYPAPYCHSCTWPHSLWLAGVDLPQLSCTAGNIRVNPQPWTLSRGPSGGLAQRLPAGHERGSGLGRPTHAGHGRGARGSLGSRHVASGPQVPPLMKRKKKQGKRIPWKPACGLWTTGTAFGEKEKEARKEDRLEAGMWLPDHRYCIDVTHAILQCCNDDRAAGGP